MNHYEQLRKARQQPCDFSNEEDVWLRNLWEVCLHVCMNGSILWFLVTGSREMMEGNRRSSYVF